MMLDREEFFKRCPVLFHMAYEGAWPSIRDNGLLSSNTVLNLFNKTPEERPAIRSYRRKLSYLLSDSRFGQIVLRDQSGMPPKGLENALRGSKITNDEWLDILDSRVFFWADSKRLHRLRTGAAYKGDPQIVLEIDTRRLFEAHWDRIEVAEFNTGYAYRRPVKRDRDSFKSLEKYQGTSSSIVEVTLQDRLDDITQFVLRVTLVGTKRESLVLFAEDVVPQAI